MIAPAGGKRDVVHIHCLMIFSTLGLMLPIEDQNHGEAMPDLFQILLLLVWAAAAVFWMKNIIFRLGKYRTYWYRPSKCEYKKEITWNDVKEILQNDPLDFKPEPRGIYKEVVLDLILILISGLIIFILIFYTIVNFICIKKFISSDGGVFSAVLALIGGIYVAFLQLSAKVRSENRQKWINEIRESLSIVITGSPLNSSLFPYNRSSTEGYNVNKNRVKIELLLNPSEADHRALSTILRISCNRDKIEIDEIVLNKLSMNYEDLYPWVGNGNFIDVEKSDCRKKRLISMIIRLSNSVLKREWEMVKFGK